MNRYTITTTCDDTFPGAVIDLTAELGETVDLSTANINMDFRLNSKTGTLSLSIEDGYGITISGVKQFEIDKQVFDLAAGTYYSDCEITLTNGDVYTPVSIKWIIEQDVTK